MTDQQQPDMVEQPEESAVVEKKPLDFLSSNELTELSNIEKSILRSTPSKNFYGVLENNEKPVIEFIPTGCMTLDYLFGGGIPKGLIMEFIGENSVGKSVLMTTLLAAVQRSGKLVALIDAEHCFDPDFATMCGLNLDKLALVKPDNLEEALELMRTLIKCGKFGAVGLDSVAALAPKEELDKTMDELVIGKIAKAYARLFREITATSDSSRCTILLNNQYRSNITTYGAGRIGTSGNALPYFCAIRGEMKRDKKLDKDDSITTVIKIIKNKVAVPFKEGEITIRFPYVDSNGEVKAGIDPVSDLANMAMKLNVIVRSGAWYYYNKGEPDEIKANGKDKMVSLLEVDEEIREKVMNSVREKIING